MPPANNSFATAVTFTFPCDITQTDINDAGVNHAVYYRFVAPSGARVVSAWGFSGNIAAGYRPNILPYIGPAGTPTPILAITAQNKPIQFPVTPGAEYYLEFIPNLNDAGPNQLRVRCEIAPLAPPAQGDIIVNDIVDGFPMWVGVSATNNTTRNFVKGMAVGDAGDVLPIGRLLLLNINDNSVKLYETANFVQLFNSNSLGGTIRVKSNADRDLFYVVRYTGGQAFYRTITSLGIMNPEVTLTGEDAIDGLCADLGNLILYLAEAGPAGAIRRWDIVGNAFLTDLAIGIADYQIPDIQVLADGTILALYHNTFTQDVNVKRYSMLGAVLNTYNLGIQASTHKPRMAWAYDSINAFWVMTHNALGASVFTNFDVNTGAVIRTREQQGFDTGVYNAAETATPVSRFGNSPASVFIILHIPSPPAMYVIVPNKKYDITTAIPNPTFKTALLP